MEERRLAVDGLEEPGLSVRDTGIRLDAYRKPTTRGRVDSV